MIIQIHEFLRRYCFARNKPSLAFKIDVARYCLQILALFLAFFTGHGSVSGSLYIMALCALLSTSLLFAELPKLCINHQYIVVSIRRHWGMAKWLIPSSLLQWTSSNFFMLSAGVLLGPVAVGAMRAVQSLLSVTQTILQALDNWASVRAAHVYKDSGVEGLNSFIQKVQLYIGLSTALILLIIALPAEFWMALFYGDAFADYAWIVLPYAFAPLLAALNTPYRYSFAAREKTRPIFVGYIFASIFSLATSYPLISTFGLLGALLGIVGVHFILLFVFFWSHSKWVRS